MKPIEITSSNFEQEVLQSAVPVLLDLWAPWCGPCRMQSPIIEEIAGEVDDFKVGTVNVDDQPEIAAMLKVRGIPTLVVYKNGEPAARVTGVQSKEQVLALVRG